MKNPEALRKLLHSMNAFSAAYHALQNEIGNYEAATGTDINYLPGFNEYYPFDTSFDEIPIDRWIEYIQEQARKNAFKVLNYEYMNTGGNTMVGIFTVWLPALKQTVYALTNETGCTITTVDYISNDIGIDDYDEVTIDRCDFDSLHESATHFELYRYCLNEYTKSDCRYFGHTYAWPYQLLSDELQANVARDYLKWCNENNNGCIPTDGVNIVEHPDYFKPEEDWRLNAVKDFRKWHDDLISNATDEEMQFFYDRQYRLYFMGKRAFLPFDAETFNKINDLLDSVIKEW